MVSAGRSMFLLVVIILAGCFVPAGSYRLCWWLRVPAGRHTSAGGFIFTDTFMLLALFMLSKHLFKLLNWFVLHDTAGWSVSTGSHSVSTGSIQSCWYNHVSADE
uniref:Uncharacterized protein n=1 Tax=Tanacetum cinerariifolium TaxID=118510 RepID=A0A699Q635_TANCI|nr:hypothetical protein [Tanacetum cinerariifolium]